jgi:NTP pyrophosphatase (non-canonical NTP hydrolase)
MINVQRFLSVSPSKVQRWVREYHGESVAADVVNARSALAHKEQYTDEEAAFRVFAIEAQQEEVDERIDDPLFLPLANKHLGLFLRTSTSSYFSLPVHQQRNNLLSSLASADDNSKSGNIAYQLLAAPSIPVGYTSPSNSQEVQALSTRFLDIAMNVTAQEFVDVVHLCFEKTNATVALLSLLHPDFEELLEALTSQELVLFLCVGALPLPTLEDEEERVERYKSLTEYISEELQDVLVQSGILSQKLGQSAATTLIDTQQEEMAALAIAPLTPFEEAFVRGWKDEGTLDAVARRIGMRVPQDFDVGDYLYAHSHLYTSMERNDFEKVSRFGVVYASPEELDTNLALLDASNDFFVLRSGMCTNEDPISFDDVSPPTVAFGTKTSYTCLSLDVLLELIDAQGAKAIHPVTQEVMGFRQTLRVLELLRMYSQELQLTQQQQDTTLYLLEKVEEQEAREREAQRLSAPETRKLRSFLFSVFDVGMRMRGWTGTGPYPTMRDTLRRLTEQEEQAIAQEVFSLQEGLEQAPKLREVVSAIAVYGVGEQDIVQKPSSLLELLFKVDQDCIRLLSTEFILTAYMALKTRFNEEIAGFSPNNLFSTSYSVDELEELLQEAPLPTFAEFNSFLEKKNQEAHEALVSFLLPRTGAHKQRIENRWLIDADVLYRLAIDFYDEVKNAFPSFRVMPELAFAANNDLGDVCFALLSLTAAPALTAMQIAVEKDSAMVLEKCVDFVSSSQVELLFDTALSKARERQKTTESQRDILALLASRVSLDADSFLELLEQKVFAAVEEAPEDIVEEVDFYGLGTAQLLFVIGTFELPFAAAQNIFATALRNGQKQVLAALSEQWNLRQLSTADMEKNVEGLFADIMGI